MHCAWLKRKQPRPAHTITSWIVASHISDNRADILLKFHSTAKGHIMSLGQVRSARLMALLVVSSILSSGPNPAQAYWQKQPMSLEPRSKRAPVLILAQTTPSATYKYDAAGRTVTTLFTDQTCVIHQYDSQGNRVATTITKADR